MRAQALLPGYGKMMDFNTSRGNPVERHSGASARRATPLQDTPGTAAAPTTMAAERAAMLMRYRADPVAFRREITGPAHSARNQAIGAWFAGIFAIA